MGRWNLVTALVLTSMLVSASPAVASPAGASPVVAEPFGSIETFPIPSKPAGPQGLAPGPDRAEWFAELDTGKIGRITEDGKFTEFPTPNASGAFLRDITAGPDHAMWFTDSGECNNDNCDFLVNGKIGRITMKGQITEFPVPTAKADPWNITAGPDGNLWFTEIGDYFNPSPTNVANIGRITPWGQITEFQLPTLGSSPNGITVGPDGALWFTENTADKIGRITTGGSITEFALPSHKTKANPIGITRGADGNLWFTERTSQRIGRITPWGDVTEFPLPHGGLPVRIATGADGAAWFTEVLGHRIGRITTDGTITEFALPSNQFPLGIAPGPRGENLYYGAVNANVIGKINVTRQDAPPHRR